MGLNRFKKDISGINVDKVWQKKGMLAYQGLSDFFFKLFFQQSIMEISSLSLRQENEKDSFKGHKERYTLYITDMFRRRILLWFFYCHCVC